MPRLRFLLGQCVCGCRYCHGDPLSCLMLPGLRGLVELQGLRVHQVELQGLRALGELQGLCALMELQGLRALAELQGLRALVGATGSPCTGGATGSPCTGGGGVILWPGSRSPSARQLRKHGLDVTRAVTVFTSPWYLLLFDWLHKTFYCPVG